MSAKRFLISGRVQGVFFRASTRKQAERLGLCGHALNLDDGRVEVLAIGSAAGISELAEWLWQGPSGARVEDVRAESVEPADCEAPDGFRCG